ncbi:MAG: hypothetical protein A2X12_10460 [Bacteroidetes bacterium GWE2_29_8]|nr:MAG: hypothetical protein A2X12_10460 [Bacteroidetes bacterium GWE2_29_8]OFY21045.1 MAG: hypothetical protein A2X02_07270 [Bacteroidetes bacterium GWF2_29_10]
MQEWLGISLLGDSLIKFAFLLILVSILCIFLNKVYQKEVFYRIAKGLNITVFIILATSVLLLYYLIFEHRFEFYYVWKYTSLNLETIYLISALWAGQNGSILFWVTFQAIILLFIKHNSRNKNTILIISFIQLMLVFLIIGIKMGDLEIGRGIFTLLSDASEYQHELLFNNPQYLQFINDGNDINPILKHPLMSIHPPLLFMGYVFAAFLYASTANFLITQNKKILNVIQLWNLLALLFVSLGIISGGFWAHESLSFGGFWTWDPIENASLSIWIFLIVSTHTNLITIKNKFNYLTNAVINLLPFIITIYTSFLTRSGLLNETSVHAFADKEYKITMFFYLIIILIFSIIISIVYLRNNKKVSATSNIEINRENLVTASMFVLLILNIKIILSISLPIINYIINSNLTLPIDTIGYYNKNVSFFTIIINILFCFSLYLYKAKTFKKKSITIIASFIIIASGIIIPIELYENLTNTILFTSSLMAILLLFFIKQNNAAKLSHVGIFLLIISFIISFSETKLNQFHYQNNKIEIKQNEYSSLNSKLKVKLINIQHTQDIIKYHIQLTASNRNDSTIYDLFPFSRISKNFGIVNEPYIFRTFATDLFFNIANLEQKQPHNINIKLHDTTQIDDYKFIFDKIEVVNLSNQSNTKESIQQNIENLKIKAYFSINNNIKSHKLQASYIIKNNNVYFEDDSLQNLNLKIRFVGISDNENTIKVRIEYLNPNTLSLFFKDFPFFSLIIISLLILFTGLIYSIVNRIVSISKIKA